MQTLHSICRIAEVLLALQQKGNVKYTGWILNFHCKVEMVNKLQQQAKHMEEELQIWEEEVQQVRNEYYELNYYTTLQLLALCKELGRLKTFSQPLFCAEINPHILALLESISTEISSPCVWEVVTGKQQTEGEAALAFTAQYQIFLSSMTRTSSKVAQIAQPNQPRTSSKVVQIAQRNQPSTTSKMAQIVQPNQPQRTVSHSTWRKFAWLSFAWLALSWFVLGSISLALVGLLVLAWLFSPASASANVHHTSASTSHLNLQQPILTQDQLNEKQKETFDNLTNCDHPQQPALIALQEDQRKGEENWTSLYMVHLMPKVGKVILMNQILNQDQNRS